MYMRTQNNIRISFLLSFFFLSLSTVTAQTSSPTETLQKVRIGLKFSPTFNWAKVLQGSLESKGLPISIGYGVMVDFNIAKNPNYWLSTEFNITTLSSKLESSKPLFIRDATNLEREFTDVVFKYKSQMIQIPISLKLRSNAIGNLHYYGSFGFAPGVAYSTRLSTSTNEEYYSDGNSHTPNASSNDELDFNGNDQEEGVFKDNYLPVRVGLIVGAGIEAKISGKTMLNVGLQFNNGLVDQFLDDKFKARTNYLALNLGVFF